MVSPAALVPIALREEGHSRAWVRPLRSGRGFAKASETLRGALESEISSLLPTGDLVVQTFQDQKTSRAGFGDVLFTPFGSEALRPRPEALRAILGVLDPELLSKNPAVKSH